MLKSHVSGESAPELFQKPGILLLPSSLLYLSFAAEEHTLIFCHTLEGEEINDDE